jgi:hypothetical protein
MSASAPVRYRNPSLEVRRRLERRILTIQCADLLSELFLLKPKIRELQRSAVFGYVADELVGSSISEVSLDLSGDFNLRSDEARKVLNHFLGDPSGVPAETERVRLNEP